MIRQVSPVWPACWGYSCTGPTTYFGPKHFNASGANGFTITLDVKLETDAVFSIGASAGKSSFAGIRLDSKNGTAPFSVGKFHKVAVTFKTDSVTATLDGKPLTQAGGVVGKGIADGFFIEMSIDRYIFADVDNFMLSA